MATTTRHKKQIRSRKAPAAAKTLNLEKRRGMVLELALQGGSYVQIAQQLCAARDSGDIEPGLIPPGYDRKAAWEDLQHELKIHNQENATLTDEFRRLEDCRLDTLIQACQEGVNIGDVGSINTVIRLSESKRKLWGVDAPDRYEVTGADGGPIQYEDVSDRLYAKLFGGSAAQPPKS